MEPKIVQSCKYFFLGISDLQTMPPIDPRWAKAKRFPVHAAVDRYV